MVDKHEKHTDGKEPGSLQRRDLQEASPEHVSSDHVQPIVIEVDGKSITCNDNDLTEQEQLHCKEFLEQDGNNAWGSENVGWTEPVMPDPTAEPTPTPTKEPTPAPVTPSPSKGPTGSPSRSPSEATGEPSYHPTPFVEPWVLSGTAYFDSNANGRRDSNVDTRELGLDVEWTVGLGGVTIQLMECDAETNEVLGPAEVAMKYGASDNSYASTMTAGVDVLQRPKLVKKGEGGGRFTLTGIKIGRAYVVYVRVPPGFLISGGVCNDDVEGLTCVRGNAAELAKLYDDNGRRRLRPNHEGRGLLGRLLQSSHIDSLVYEPTEAEMQLGVQEGRSERCVSVDRQGKPDSHLDIGVFKVGDMSFDDTEVELKLDLVDTNIDPKMVGGRERARELFEDVRDRLLQGRAVPPVALTQEDKDAIGLVTSEVIASNLDKSLENWGAVLDSVSPLDVVYIAPKPEPSAATADSSTAHSKTNDGRAVDTTAARDAPTPGAPQGRASKGKLAVSLLVRGHYSQGLNVDFDYIVQDSINRDTHTIRRQLTYYNENCRDQTTKVVDLGFTLNDFEEIHTTKGVKKPANRLESRLQQQELDDEQVFSSACNQKKVLPEYFEASIGGLELRAKAKNLTYSVEEGGQSTWAIVGIIVAVGVVALSVAFFLFRRGLKKKQKEREARVTHMMTSPDDVDDVSLDAVDEKIQKLDGMGRSAREKSKGGMLVAVPVPAEGSRQRSGLAGRMRREIGNMTAALGSERSRLVARGGSTRRAAASETARHDSVQSGTSGSSSDLEARLQNNLSDEADADVVLPAMENVRASATSGPSHQEEPDESVSNVEGATGSAENAGLDQVAALGGRRNARSTARSTAASMTSAAGSCTSRNAAPKIVQMKFDDESSSSDDDESSDSSSSSSSSEESEAPSHPRTRERRARKAAARKRKQKRGGSGGKQLDASKRSEGSGSGKKLSSPKKTKGTGKRRKGLTRHPSQDDLEVGRYGRHHSLGAAALRRSKCDIDMDARRRSSDLL